MTAVVRIGIDGGTWGNQRGYGRFTRELVTALARHGRHRYSLLIDRATAARSRHTIPESIAVVPVDLDGSPSEDASASGWRSPRDMWRMGRALSAAPVDMIFFPSVYTYVPVLRRVPTVVTIHDVIAERYPSLVFSGPRARLFWTAKVMAARWQADRILTVSEHAARGVREVFGVAPRRLRVTGEAPAALFRQIDDPRAVAAALAAIGIEPGTEAVAYVGGLSPHKNVAALVRVFARVAAGRPGRRLRLLLIGDYERDVFLSAYPALKALIERECRDQVILTGRVADDRLALILNGVQVAVLPSFDEGFGLPAVEAAACGAAVIATRASAIPEVLGDAALYIEPSDEATLQGALVRILDNEGLRRDLGARGAARAGALSWQGSAERVEQVFDELAPGAPTP